MGFHLCATESNHTNVTRLLPTATGLFIQLSNPLNITLLASQILAADVFSPRPIALFHCRRIFSVFYTAAARAAQHQLSRDEFIQHLNPDDWAKAVIRGADDKSPRWRHLLLLGGILLGLEEQQSSISSHVRTKLESALVTASNLALESTAEQDPETSFCVVFVLNHTFHLLSDLQRSRLEYRFFLPVALDALFFSHEGLAQGYWLGMIDQDIKETSGRKFNWSPKSPTFQKFMELKSRILVSNLGILSRLIAHAIDQVQEPLQASQALDRVAEFARCLATSWRQNKLSEVDVSEERGYLDPETLQVTLPPLLQVLRDSLFAVIILLRATLGRCLCDPVLALDAHAPLLAIQALHILRHLQFIASRFGQTSSSQYVFVNFTAIDILSQFPDHVHSFLQAIRPVQLGRVPIHPLDRTHDLFFLNTAEHFTLVTSAGLNENLILASALPCISTDAGRGAAELYEAAHSVCLAVFVSPQCAELASRQLPFYIEALMQSFPQKLSPRQFRLAVRSIAKIAAPSSTLQSLQPLLQSILLEMLVDRTNVAAERPLAPLTTDQGPDFSPQPISEKSVLTLTLIDSLPFLTVAALLDWLPRTTEIINKISDPPQRSACQQWFWETLSTGKMDAERAAACVAWWNSRGGREHLLYNDQVDEEEHMMTGAIQQDSKL